MSALVLLNKSNKLKKEKKNGFSNIISLLCDKFEKSNNTKEHFSDCICHVTLKLSCSHIVGV